MRRVAFWIAFLFVSLIIPSVCVSATPERVILSYGQDSTDAVSITWRSGIDETKPVIQIAEATDNRQFEVRTREARAQTHLFSTRGIKANQNSVIIDGLKAGTTYCYRVGDGLRWSEWYQFRTASDDTNEPFCFIYLADTQNDIKAHCSRVMRQALLKAPGASFYLHAGDLVSDSYDDDSWAEWFYSLGWIAGTVPQMVVPGNHEYGLFGLTPFWRPQFSMPENGPRGLEETSYYFDYQGARIVAINTMVELSKQATWLERVLSDAGDRWLIVFMHYPMYSTAKNRDNPSVREAFLEVFDKYGVDLVLQGHDHSYGRTMRLRGGQPIAEGSSGTVYVNSVTGPKMYQLNGDGALRIKAGENTQLYHIITIDQQRLSFEARTATGSLYDSFELRK